MGAGARLKIGLFLAGLALPLAQTVTRLLPEPSLAGVEEQAGRPGLTARGWWDGSFQKGLEEWYATHAGLRPWLVKTDNQLALTLFGELRTGGTPLVRGPGDWLFETSYVTRYNRGLRSDPEALRSTVAGLERLRALLAERGIGLVVVLAPSKAEIYPDHLPPELALPGRELRSTPYDRLAPLLEASGLDVVDAHRLFLERRASGDRTLLFARGGTHWNHYGAALVVERILADLERERPGRFVTIDVTGARVDGRVWTADNDLGRLLNVWDDRPFRGPQTHPVISRREAGRRPARLLFVGDSFSLTLIELMTEERLMEPGDDLYYFERRIRYPGESSTKVDRGSFDPAAELAGVDAVVLVTNEYWLPGIGFGFVPAAIAGLERQGRGQGGAP